MRSEEIFRLGAEAMKGRIAAALTMGGEVKAAVMVLQVSTPEFQVPEVMEVGASKGMFKHVYFDGCNGDVMSEVLDFEEAVRFLVGRSFGCSVWSEELARERLGGAVGSNEEVVVDYAGDGHSRLIPV